MTKRDLVARIARKTGQKHREVMETVQLAFDMINNEVSAGRRIEFRNFGVFEPMVRKSRIGRNPNKPEETVTIPERVVVKFKPGKIMKQGISKLDPSDI